VKSLIYPDENFMKTFLLTYTEDVTHIGDDSERTEINTDFLHTTKERAIILRDEKLAKPNIYSNVKLYELTEL